MKGIRLSNDHVLKYVVASGALAFNGKGWPWERPLVWLGLIKPELFTVVLKTLTLHPRSGNYRWWKPWDCVRLIPGGSVNKVGLTNPGIRWWRREIGQYLDFQKIPLVASIYGNREEMVEMAKMFNEFDFVALEVNPSCPNTGHAMQEAKGVIDDVKAVKYASGLPIIVKVSVAQDYISIARGLKDVAEAISLNSVPWESVFYKKKSPLGRLEKKVGGGGGGVSGKPAQKFNWFAAEELKRQGAIPVIWPSVMDEEDVKFVQQIGADAISFGAIHFRTPWKPTKIVEKEMSCRK